MRNTNLDTLQSANPRDAALIYSQDLGWPVFPMRVIVLPNGSAKKVPRISKKDGGHGFKDATRDPAQIREWWQRYPDALIGLPTGQASGVIALDVDCKKEGANGFHTLADYYALYDFPDTPQVFTRSAGGHAYFAYSGSPEIRNSVGINGLGPGLDIRGEGGLVVLPSINSGYAWHTRFNPFTVDSIPAPDWLGHKQKIQRAVLHRSTRRFDPQTILDEACENIRNAALGSKYRTVRCEPFIVACLVRDGLLPEKLARHQLEAALVSLGRRVDDYDHMVEAYEGAFDEGLAAPSYYPGRRPRQ